MDSMTRWRAWKGRRPDRHRAQRRPDRRRRTPRLEGLEDRRLLSTILWMNRDKNDGFGVFDNLPQAVPNKPNSVVARELVDQAIRDWQNAIVNFNHNVFSGDGNTFLLEISAHAFENISAIADAQVTQTDIATVKDNAAKPVSGTIRIDDDAAGSGWYFDVVYDGPNDSEGNYRFDHAEFDEVTNRFSASRSGLAPGTGADVDFYTTVLHEIGHTMGLVSDESSVKPLLINNGGFLTERGRDPITPGYTLYDFRGPTTSATLTLGGVGGLHTAIGAHPEDLMNPATLDHSRQLISDVVVGVLRDAYGYQVSASPSQDSFLANLNRTTRVLTVNGEGDASADTIAIDGLFGNVIVNVNGALRGFTPSDPSSIDFVSRIDIDAGLKRDTINVRFVPQGLPLTVDGGLDGDTINIGPAGLHNIRGDLTVIGNTVGVDRLSVGSESDAADLAFTINPGPTGTRDGAVRFRRGDDPERVITFQTIEEVYVLGGTKANTFDVPATPKETKVELRGTAATRNAFRISPVAKNLDTLGGPLSIFGGDGFNTLDVDDSSNAAGSTYTLDDVLLTRGPAQVQFSNIDEMVLRGGRGNNTYNVEATLAHTPTKIVGGVGDDTFNLVPTSENLADIAGFLDIQGGDGSNRLSVEDQKGLATPASYSLSALSLERNGHIHFSHAGIDELVLLGNHRGNTYNVESVAANMILNLIAGNGDDTFHLAPESQDLDGIGQAVRLIGGKGRDTVLADDRKNDVGATYLLTESGFSRNGKGVAAFNAGIDALTILAGEQNDTFDVAATVAETPADLLGGGGSDTFHLSPVAKNLDTLDGRVRIDGGGGIGTDSVLIDDRSSTTGVSYVLSSLTLLRSTAAASVLHEYAGAENWTILGGEHADMLSFSEVAPAAAVTYDPGAGDDTLAGMPRSNLFALSGINAGTMSGTQASGGLVTFTGTENLTGGISDDTFRILPGFHVSGRFNGGGGSDTLDYTAFTTKTIVNMDVGQATGTFGISAIENAIGGSGDDDFVGDAADNILLGNGGRDSIFGRQGNDVLVGGEGDDELDDSTALVPGKGERNILIGGEGADTLRGLGGKEDLMIGGSTVHDANLAALRAIRDEWTSEQRMETRVAHLRGTGGGLNGGVLLKFGVPDATVLDDAIADLMTGGAMPDWFFAAANDNTDRGPDDFLN